MKCVLRVTAAVALLALALSPGFARAQVNTSVATMPVQASVQSGCLIATEGVNFGAVSPLLVEEDVISAGKEVIPYNADGGVFLACGSFGPTSGTVIAINLDNGQNGAIAPILGIGTNVSAIRAMTNGTSFLLYDCFKPTYDILANTFETCSNTGAESANGEWGSGGGGGPSSLLIPASTYDSCVKKGLTITGAPAGTLSGGGSSICTIPVCCSIPGDQVQPLTPGIYTDTVAVTVLF